MSDFFEILTYPDQFLIKPTTPVQNIDGKFQEAVNRMAATMYQAPGVGLAAIQVGLDQSFLIYDVAPQDDKRDLQVLVNPTIISMKVKSYLKMRGVSARRTTGRMSNGPPRF